MHSILEEEEEDRQRRRVRRREAHLVTLLCNKIPLDSLKHKEETKGRKLSFGSNRDRDVLPVKNSFWDPKFCVNIKKDVKELPVSTCPRFLETAAVNQVPAPNFYKLPENRTKAWDFKKDLPRRGNVGSNSNPGPGTYRLPLSSFDVTHSKPACFTICEPYHEACLQCNEITTGDYFYLPLPQGSVAYCRSCFQDQIKSLDKNKRIVNRTKKAIGYLNKFQRVRNCSFFHHHLDTDHAVTNPNISSLTKKFRLENYLARFKL